MHLVPPSHLSSRTVEPDDNFTAVLNLWNLKQGEKLVSVCAGVNASLNLEIPFSTGDNYLFFYSSLKFRYIHSYMVSMPEDEMYLIIIKVFCLVR